MEAIGSPPEVQMRTGAIMRRSMSGARKVLRTNKKGRWEITTRIMDNEEAKNIGGRFRQDAAIKADTMRETNLKRMSQEWMGDVICA